MKKMLKKLKVTASVLAVSAMFLMPTAHAEQAAVMPVQEDENCIKAVMEFLGIDTEESKFGLGGSLFRKNGFEVQDGRLYHYTDSQLDVYQPGFVQIEDGVYHVSEEGSAIDSYPAGFAVVDGVLCHRKVKIHTVLFAVLLHQPQHTSGSIALTSCKKLCSGIILKRTFVEQPTVLSQQHAAAIQRLERCSGKLVIQSDHFMTKAEMIRKIIRKLIQNIDVEASIFFP